MRKKEKTDEEKREYSAKLRGSILLSIIVLLPLKWAFPSIIPFGVWEFWPLKGDIVTPLRNAWLLFLWGAGLSMVVSFSRRNPQELNRHAERILVGGAIASVLAGLFEEIMFRWLLFLSGIALVKLGNFLVFGFLGFGVAEWLHLYVFGPLANWTTLGHLKDVLFHEAGWAVGASVLYTNAIFRDGHKYHGFIGFVNSWFVGMFLFYILFTYGLPACIIIHVLYDLICFSVSYVDAAIERARGFA